jgi:hypothetical protein
MKKKEKPAKAQCFPKFDGVWTKTAW